MPLQGLEHRHKQAKQEKSSGFTSLEVKNGIEVIYTQSPQASLKVEADNQAYLDRIATEFGNGTLRIYFREEENNLKLALNN